MASLMTHRDWLIQRKKELEDTLEKELRTFENETGLEISDINIHRADFSSAENKETRINFVQTLIELK